MIVEVPEHQYPPFPHRHAGHCESGVTSSLMSHYGLRISEPMAFGISSAMTFVHLPFIKMGGIPLTAYRMFPGHILRGIQKRLHVTMDMRRYRSAAEGMRDLDRLLDAGHPVGLQTSVFWLPYIPRDMRFHFNAHNLIAYAKTGDEYLISDPVIDRPMRCAAEALQKARFTKGPFAPKGFLYFPKAVDPQVDFNAAIRKAIRRTANGMLYAPMPFVGVSAIRGLARRIANLERKHPDEHYRRLYLSSIIRMQEEIGTGGGGFRFIYASFLQEAAALLALPELQQASEMMTAAGDQWREFASQSAFYCKGRASSDLRTIADALLECAEQEQRVYRFLRSIRFPDTLVLAAA